VTSTTASETGSTSPSVVTSDPLLKVLADLSEYFDETALLEAAMVGEDASPSAVPDKGIWVDSVLNKLEHSKTVKLLKLCHQNVLGIGVYRLKMTPVLDAIMTKDDRSEDGWRIIVELSSDTVRVAHRRRELIMDTTTMKPSDDTLSWELSMMLSSDMENVTAVSLRITEVGVHSAEGQKVKERLAGGNLIL
jgi:hypothetical protein